MVRSVPEDSVVWLLLRLLMLGAFSLVWYLVYAGLNSWGSERCVYWENPGIYVPWSVYLYVFGAGVVAAAPFHFHRARRSFFRLLAVYTMVSAVFFVFYVVFPVCIQRSAYEGAGIPEVLMRLVVGLDQPANCFPSSHCMFATLGFLGVRKAGVGPAASVVTGLLAAAVCVSTILVGQHYLADVIVGVGLAAVLFSLTYRRILPEGGADPDHSGAGNGGP